MTIRELIQLYPDLFYSQEWYSDELFMDAELPAGSPIELPDTLNRDPVTWHIDKGVSAVTLVNLYVRYPMDPIWDRYLWTSDTDQHGQRVYVGSNGKGLEIHRFIHLTKRFGVPIWET